MITVTVSDLWFTYIDWTEEQVPRVFYVGKGNLCRTKDTLLRNIVWKRIVKKHGYKREIIFASREEKACLDLEQQLIIEYNTCVHVDGGWGANLCLGGNGPTGARWSKKAKRRLSVSVKKLWKNADYRQKLMVECPVSLEQLVHDGAILPWDSIANKYNVSATTVKRWFKAFALLKSSVLQVRRSWSLLEDDKLFELYKKGKLVREIASIMNRTECSIKKRVQRICDTRGVYRSRFRRKNNV